MTSLSFLILLARFLSLFSLTSLVQGVSMSFLHSKVALGFSDRLYCLSGLYFVYLCSGLYNFYLYSLWASFAVAGKRGK